MDKARAPQHPRLPHLCEPEQQGSSRARLAVSPLQCCGQAEPRLCSLVASLSRQRMQPRVSCLTQEPTCQSQGEFCQRQLQIRPEVIVHMRLCRWREIDPNLRTQAAKAECTRPTTTPQGQPPVCVFSIVAYLVL